MKTEYQDFPLRISETLNTLEKAEKRSHFTQIKKRSVSSSRALGLMSVIER
ncbi:hypothetical protein H6F98_18265 [Microcoleus sp. FACHB-SPT15]|uniref:hypothetical protein n=1 Tax=Microcoleus sp. FACHB-SPT15 TaxID=2692830 RepID=UPI00178677DB|nr:hypothetical protein [Microcoleus sp. FACHB-SPT15]MBD1807376.1 hypothetical protein [Microcoleus sp. FACHB-SPT15]